MRRARQGLYVLLHPPGPSTCGQRWAQEIRRGRGHEGGLAGLHFISIHVTSHHESGRTAIGIGIVSGEGESEGEDEDKDER